MELSEREKQTRSESGCYFKNGKPKKKYMMCKGPDYIREVISNNGHYDPNWACAGCSCPLYSTGCDNRGKKWE